MLYLYLTTIFYRQPADHSPNADPIRHPHSQYITLRVKARQWALQYSNKPFGQTRMSATILQESPSALRYPHPNGPRSATLVIPPILAGSIPPLQLEQIQCGRRLRSTTPAVVAVPVGAGAVVVVVTGGLRASNIINGRPSPPRSLLLSLRLGKFHCEGLPTPTWRRPKLGRFYTNLRKQESTKRALPTIDFSSSRANSLPNTIRI